MCVSHHIYAGRRGDQLSPEYVFARAGTGLQLSGSKRQLPPRSSYSVLEFSTAAPAPCGSSSPTDARSVLPSSTVKAFLKPPFCSYQGHRFPPARSTPLRLPDACPGRDERRESCDPSCTCDLLTQACGQGVDPDVLCGGDAKLLKRGEEITHDPCQHLIARPLWTSTNGCLVAQLRGRQPGSQKRAGEFHPHPRLHPNRLEDLSTPIHCLFPEWGSRQGGIALRGDVMFLESQHSPRTQVCCKLPQHSGGLRHVHQDEPPDDGIKLLCKGQLVDVAD